MARIRNAFGVPFIISSPPKVEFTRAKDAARPAGICEFQNYLYRARLIYDFRLTFRDRGAESFSKAFQHFRLSRLLHPKLSLWHSALETCTRTILLRVLCFLFFFSFRKNLFFSFFFESTKISILWEICAITHFEFDVSFRGKRFFLLLLEFSVEISTCDYF